MESATSVFLSIELRARGSSKHRGTTILLIRDIAFYVRPICHPGHPLVWTGRSGGHKHESRRTDVHRVAGALSDDSQSRAFPVCIESFSSPLVENLYMFIAVGVVVVCTPGHRLSLCSNV